MRASSNQTDKPGSVLALAPRESDARQAEAKQAEGCRLRGGRRVEVNGLQCWALIAPLGALETVVAVELGDRPSAVCGVASFRHGFPYGCRAGRATCGGRSALRVGRLRCLHRADVDGCRQMQEKCLGPESNRHGVSPKGFSYHCRFRCCMPGPCICGLDFTFATPVRVLRTGIRQGPSSLYTFPAASGRWSRPGLARYCRHREVWLFHRL